VYGVPRRQRQLIEIGRQQVEVQRASVQTIARSNIASAQIIAAEIQQQTLALDERLCKYSDRVSSSVMDAADQISSAIEFLGDRLCAYLGEIRWELAQQSETLAGILHVLRESRSNEARQLVEQGVRHYTNEQYDRAEERFKQAIEKDTTDYQVLMNLGLVAVHKGDSPAAVEFFRDALRLPASQDDYSKTRALLAIARVHYADSNYIEAHRVAAGAIESYGTSDASDLFVSATYAALSGLVDESVSALQACIRKDAIFFSRAAVEPDLEPFRGVVLELLSKLAQEILETRRADIHRGRLLLEKALHHTHASYYADLTRRALTRFDELEHAVEQASYSELLKFEQRAESFKPCHSKDHRR